MQQPVFRAGADTVPVFVTVTDKSGRLVPDLTRDDFRLFDNGKPQTLSVFDNSPQPIRLIVMVDVSGSMFRNLTLLRAASEQLLRQLGPGDLVRIGTFGDEIEIGKAFTRDLNELLADVPTSISPRASTPLWNAIDQAIGDFGPAEGRPVVLVMSDSKDTGPRFGRKWQTQLDVLDRATREDVMIYGIGVRSRGAGGGDFGRNPMAAMVGSLRDPGLGTLAEATGGGYLELLPRDDLASVFARVLDELHHQYLLGFAPPAKDGKEHTIEVTLATKDMKVRARKKYRADK
jgi:VWFA-related protein